MLFYTKNEKNSYLYDEKDGIDKEKLEDYNKNLYVPLVIDTEFTGLKRIGVTVQISDIREDNPIIFAHPDLEDYAINNGLTLRHKVLKEQFSPIDYLKYCGYDVVFSSREDKRIKENKTFKGKELPVIHFDIFAHFALAELLMIAIEDAREDLTQLAKRTKGCRLLEMTRRLRTVTYSPEKKQVSDYIEMPWEVFLNGSPYRVRIRIIDTCALHGMASYKNLCDTLGIELKYKENLTQTDKENMIETYFNKPEDFDNYSLGDLKVYEILEKNNDLFKKVYESLGILKYYNQPNLTIGSTIQKLFKAVLFNHFGISEDDKDTQKRLIEQCHWASASILKTKTDYTDSLLAKINGGRCRNNRPLTSFLEGTIIDIDIVSAYGNGLRHQIYPIGRPIIEGYEVSDNNGYLTLREWLKHRKYGKKNDELINGLWCCYVSNKQDKNGNYETLRYEQDFITSWFDFKYEQIAKMGSDSDFFDYEVNPKTGKVKILNNQVINGVITSDILDVIYNVCSPQQRNELLDNLYISVSCYYPSYSKLDSLEDLLDAWENWEDKNTVTSKKVKKSHKLPSGQVIKIINEPTYWIALPLGKLVIDNLITWRKYYQYKDGKKCSMQTLFKLACNTLYGVFCSPYFDVSNTIVGNCVTARCRMMAWAMEKDFNMAQAITDGGQFNINKVIYPSNETRQITVNSVTNLYRERTVSNNKVIERPLDNCDNIKHFYDEKDRYEDKKTGKTFPKIKLVITKNGKETIINNANDWINEKSLDHLRKHFNLSILQDTFNTITIDKEESLKQNKPIVIYQETKGLYSLEIKDIYDYGCFHGTANYYMENRNNNVLAMRSYESNRKHFTFELSDNGDYIETSFYNEDIPSHYFLTQLRHNATIKRGKPFKKLGILKLNDFKNNKNYLKDGFYCGDSIEKTGILRELSLSQFTFKTMTQLLSIEKEAEQNKRRYGQSYEGYFINEDGSLNFAEMIKTLDFLISQGYMKFNNYLDKHRHRIRDLNIIHPEKKLYEILKENYLIEDKLKTIQAIDYDELTDEFICTGEDIESDIDF